MMVPFVMKSQFIGGEVHLEDLRTRYERPDRHNRLALMGLGGIG